MADGDKIIPLHPLPDVSPEDRERARKLVVEVERMARLPMVEWMHYVAQGDIPRQHGIEPAMMKAMIEAVINSNEKKAKEPKADDRRGKQDDRREKW